MAKCPYCGSKKSSFLGSSKTILTELDVNIYKCKKCGKLFAVGRQDLGDGKFKLLRFKAERLPICYNYKNEKMFCITSDILEKAVYTYRFLGITFFFDNNYLYYTIGYEWQQYYDLYVSFLVDGLKVHTFTIK